MDCLNTLEALQITTTKVKKYVDEKPVVSYEESQTLGVASRTIAKSNIGVYVGADEPTDALDGDIWMDTDDNEGGSGGSSGSSKCDLPTVTTDNNGAFLRVVDGKWAVATIENAEGVAF